MRYGSKAMGWDIILSIDLCICWKRTMLRAGNNLDSIPASMFLLPLAPVLVFLSHSRCLLLDELRGIICFPASHLQWDRFLGLVVGWRL